MLDLKRLTGLEVDADTMTVIVEPGVTFEQLKAHLDAHHPDLAYTLPLRPALHVGADERAARRPQQPVRCRRGDGALAHRGRGRAGRRFRGPHGHGRRGRPLVRPGAAARPHRALRVDAGDHRHRAARAVWPCVPKPAHRSRWFAFCWSLDDANRAMRALARTGSVDDVGCMTWPSAKLLFGATRGLVRADDEPMAFLFIDLTGASAAELDARRDLARQILAEAGVDPPFEVSPPRATSMPGMAKLAELPTTARLPPRLPGRGLAWVGSYGPRRVVAGAEAGLAVLERHGFPPFLVARPMEHGRYHVLRYVACFDRADEEEVGPGAVGDVRARRRRARPRLRAVQGVGRRRSPDPRSRPIPGSGRSCAQVQRLARPRAAHEPRALAENVTAQRARPERACSRDCRGWWTWCPFVPLADGLPTPASIARRRTASGSSTTT